MPELDPSVPDLGEELMELVERLFPICRSITGDGLRETLRILGEYVPIEIREVPSGTEVLDWVVPLEWNIRDAYVANSSGDRVIDFAASNLHVVSYSVPVHARMSLAELRPHLHSLPDHPNLVPYRTSYYTESWGFCLAQSQLDDLPETDYEVHIDSSLEPGSLTYGEIVVPGRTNDEILVSSHACHPSLCDDNLTGIAVSLFLARSLLDGPRPRHTFRFLFAPGTIGAITWLAEHRDVVERVVHGVTLTCLGDDHPFTYKRTVDGRAPIDDYAEYVLEESGAAHQVIDYFPYGYDERQYNSPGFRMPVGSLMRGRHGMFDEYHTSADNLDFVSADRMVESFEILSRVLTVADQDRVVVNLEPFGEPQLGRRGLYSALGGLTVADAQLAMLWVLALGDGACSLFETARRSGISFDAIIAAARVLEDHGLVRDMRTQQQPDLGQGEEFG